MRDFTTERKIIKYFVFSVFCVIFFAPSRRLFRAIFNEHLIVFRTIFSFLFLSCAIDGAYSMLDHVDRLFVREK